MSAFETIQPEMLKARGPVVLSSRSEAVEVTVTDLLPILESDAQFECRLRGAHEIGFVDAEQAVVSHERRGRAFPPPPRAQPTRTHPRQPGGPGPRGGERRGPHPNRTGAPPPGTIEKRTGEGPGG